MAGISTNRSNISLPMDVAAEILQKAQEASAVMQLARRISLPGTGLTFPMITGDPEASWVDETGAKPISNPSMGTKVMQPYKLAVIVPFSDEFARDYSALYDALVERLPGALSLKFDQTVFHGSAPGSNFDVLSSVTAQAIDTALITSPLYKALVAADIDIAEHNGVLNGFAMSPQARGELLSALDGDGRPLFVNSVADGAVPRLIGHPVSYSKAVYKAGVGTDVIGFAGDWTQAMYGIVEGVKIDIADQVTLPIGADSAMVNLWQHNMFAVRAEIEIGFRADTNCFNRFTRTASGATGATGATGETGEG